MVYRSWGTCFFGAAWRVEVQNYWGGGAIEQDLERSLRLIPSNAQGLLVGRPTFSDLTEGA